MGNCISENFDWYVENLGILLGLYPQKFIVIHNRSVVVSACSFDEADDAAHSLGLVDGTFNIQFCGDETSPYKNPNPLKLVKR